MNKEIEKTQKKLHEAKLERERKKAKYDSQTAILEGQRNTMKMLEDLNQEVLAEFMESDRAVGEINNQLKKLIEDEQLKKQNDG